MSELDRDKRLAVRPQPVAGPPGPPGPPGKRVNYEITFLMANLFPMPYVC